MKYLAGIDLGTSSVKTIISDIKGNIVSASSSTYDIIVTSTNFAEQNPIMWWKCARKTIKAAILKSGIDSGNICSIGFSGQMHGLVILDKNYKPLYNAILHCDGRSYKEADQIKDIIGIKSIANILYNPIFPGFQLTSLLWLRNNEPDVYEQIRYIMSPKDYIRFMITGELGTEITDASATLLYDVEKRCWSSEILSKLSINQNILLPVHNSYEISGYVTKAAAYETGLYEGTKVVYGAADQPAQAIGNGVVSPGTVTCTIGTSGQILACTDKPLYNSLLNTHTFCHTPDNTWYSMGAILSAGLSLKWLKNNILSLDSYKEIDSMVENIELSAADPIFQPYLCGERTPHMNPDAKATFFGFTLEHNKAHMIKAVMEGVVFALKDSMTLIEGLNKGSKQIIASGGGTRSILWLQMQADILEREIITTSSDGQACLGAVILAAVGIGEYKDLNEACGVIVKKGSITFVPNQENVKIYKELYEKYRELYTCLNKLY